MVHAIDLMGLCVVCRLQTQVLIESMLIQVYKMGIIINNCGSLRSNHATIPCLSTGLVALNNKRLLLYTACVFQPDISGQLLVCRYSSCALSSMFAVRARIPHVQQAQFVLINVGERAEHKSSSVNVPK